MTSKMDAAYQSLSRRGYVDSKQDKPPFLDIIADLYHPQSNPGGYVNLGLAENTLMHKELTEVVNSTFTLTPHALTYGDGFQGSKKLRATLATFINRYFNPVLPVAAEQIAVTAGVTLAIELCAFAFGDPGDGFLLGQPYYASFVEDLQAKAGVKTVEVAFGKTDPFSKEAVSTYEQALLKSQQNGTPVKALILCSPHNPLGRCYSKEILIDLMRLCQKYQIHLISDEVYALSVWHNPDFPTAVTFTSVLSIDLAGIIDPHLVHVLWGLSKDLGANGLRIGALISQSSQAFLDSLVTTSLYSCPSGPSDIIATNILGSTDFLDTYFTTNRKRLADAYVFTTTFLKKHGVNYVAGANAAFFLWVDLGTYYKHSVPGSTKDSSDVNTLITAKLRKKKVFVASGQAFGAEKPGWFRIVFSHPQEDLEEGMRRIVAAIGPSRAKL